MRRLLAICLASAMGFTAPAFAQSTLPAPTNQGVPQAGSQGGPPADSQGASDGLDAFNQEPPQQGFSPGLLIGGGLIIGGGILLGVAINNSRSTSP